MWDTHCDFAGCICLLLASFVCHAEGLHIFFEVNICIFLHRPLEKRTEYPVWLPLLVVGIAVILGYLIYANMEPAAKSNIPGVSNKIEV